MNGNDTTIKITNYEYINLDGEIVRMMTDAVPSQFPDRFARSFGFDDADDLRDKLVQYKKSARKEDYDDCWKASARGGDYKLFGNIVRWFDARGSTIINDRESLLMALCMEGYHCAQAIRGDRGSFPSVKSLERFISVAQEQMREAFVKKKIGRELVFACAMPAFVAMTWADEKVLEYREENVEQMDRELEVA